MKHLNLIILGCLVLQLAIGFSNRAFADEGHSPERFIVPTGTTLLKEVILGHPCKNGDTPETPNGWDGKWCISGGTGLAHCDDGEIVIEVDA